VQKLIPILKAFKFAIDIILGSKHPTSHLLLLYVSAIKEMLDNHQYWSKYNLIIFIAIVLDPKLKMGTIELTFPSLCPHEVQQIIKRR